MCLTVCRKRTSFRFSECPPFEFSDGSTQQSATVYQRAVFFDSPFAFCGSTTLGVNKKEPARNQDIKNPIYPDYKFFGVLRTFFSKKVLSGVRGRDPSLFGEAEPCVFPPIHTAALRFFFPFPLLFPFLPDFVTNLRAIIC